MNYLALVNFQRIIFLIIFILSGLYLIIFLLKEILMLFIPTKQKIELTDFLMDRNIKILPMATNQPEINVKTETLREPEIIKKKYNKLHTISSSVNKIKKEKRKSRNRKDKI